MTLLAASSVTSTQGRSKAKASKSSLFSTSLPVAAVAAAVLMLRPELAVALTPLSDWYNGTATYYGGPADNMDPYSPSYGTLNVRRPCILPCTIASEHLQIPHCIPLRCAANSCVPRATSSNAAHAI